MNHKLYKIVVSFFTVCYVTASFGQKKYEKKYSETFTTDKDVTVEINASHTDINVTTWDKNVVSVEAFIEIEGVDKDQAENYFKDWNFEALGNSSKVEINAKANNIFVFKDDFVFFDNMNFEFEIPEIDSATLKAFTLPEMNFDFDFDFDKLALDLEHIEEDMEKDGDYNFTWKTEGKTIVIKSKEDWEQFKKSNDYKKFKENIKKEQVKLKKELSKSKEEIKKAMAEAKMQMATINKEEIKRELEKAKAELKKMKLEFVSEEHFPGKKVKIKKRIEIKVPKKATFELNTRHCKVKLPNVAASGNVNYGTFNALTLHGGKLAVNYAPVSIHDLTACSLFLNNVTDAKIASVTNSILSNNSSDVSIELIHENVSLKSRFGALVVNAFDPDFKVLTLDLNQSNAILYLGETRSKIEYDPSRIKFINNRTTKKPVANINNLIKVKGYFGKVEVN